MKVSRKTWLGQVGVMLAGICAVGSQSKKQEEKKETKQKFQYTRNIMLTRNVLLETESGRFELNVCGEYAKLIADYVSAQPPFVQKRYESKLLLVDKITTKDWNEFQTKCDEDFESAGPHLTVNYGLLKTHKIT